MRKHKRHGLAGYSSGQSGARSFARAQFGHVQIPTQPWILSTIGSKHKPLLQSTNLGFLRTMCFGGCHTAERRTVGRY